MTSEEAAEVLALAATLDPRLSPSDPQTAITRARAWAAALKPKMTRDWAAKAVVNHYQQTTDYLMPAHLNQRWAAYERERWAEVESAQRATGRGVPMPDHVRQQIHALLGKSKL